MFSSSIFFGRRGIDDRDGIAARRGAVVGGVGAQPKQAVAPHLAPGLGFFGSLSFSGTKVTWAPSAGFPL